MSTYMHLFCRLQAAKRIAPRWFRGAYSRSSSVSSRGAQSFNPQPFPEPTDIGNQMPRDYFIALPESLPNSPDTEIFMCKSVEEFDPSNLNYEICFFKLNKTIADFDTFISEIEESDAHDQDLQDPKRLFALIETHLYPMDCAYHQFISTVSRNSVWATYRENRYLGGKFGKARSRRFSSVKIHNAVKGFAKDMSQYEESLQTIVRIYLENGQLQGKGLDESNQLKINRVVEGLNAGQNAFVMNYRGGTDSFGHTIDDPDVLAVLSQTMSTDTMSHHNERTPIRIDFRTYNLFMRLCPDRELRESVWRAKNRRCSSLGPLRYNNENIIEGIRLHRRKLAEALGHRSYLTHRLKNTAMKTKPNIIDFLDEVHNETVPILQERLRELNEYAEAKGMVDREELGIQQWDVDFWTNKYKQDIIIANDKIELDRCFPIDKVLGGVTQFFKNVFDIDFKILSKKSKVWSDFTNVYKISSTSRGPIGGLIYEAQDSYPHSGPIHIRVHGRSDLFNCEPIDQIMHGLLQCNNGVPCVPLQEVTSVFHMVASLLRDILVQGPMYESRLGLHEEDLVDLLPRLCADWVMNDYKTLQSCSRRPDNNKPLDAEMCQRIVKANSYFNCFNTWQELYYSHFDLEVHSTQKPTAEVAKDSYALYSPFSRDPQDYDFCTFKPVFVEGRGGMYYSTILANRLSDKIFQSIGITRPKNPMSDADIANLGQKIMSGALKTAGANKEPMSFDSIAARFLQ